MKYDKKTDYLCDKYYVLKNAISILFASLILLQSFSNVWIVLSFKINQDYITNVLCINRNKPEMSCNGKCVLMQRIKAAEEKEKKETPLKLKEQKELVYHLDKLSKPIERFKVPENSPKKTFFFLMHYANAFVRDIFRPPDAHFSIDIRC